MFGSPVTPLAVRTDSVVETLAGDEQLNPRDYGLESTFKNGDPRSQPRWINIWDQDDLIAWPVEPLIRSNGSGEKTVEDVYVDVSDWTTKVHQKYWQSDKVHEELAKRW